MTGVFSAGFGKSLDLHEEECLHPLRVLGEPSTSQGTDGDAIDKLERGRNDPRFDDR